MAFPFRPRPYLLSASEAGPVELCIGRLVLPQAPESSAGQSRGTMIHDFLLRAKQVGQEQAVAEVADFLGWTGTFDDDGERLYEPLDQDTEELLDTLEAIPIHRIPEGLQPEVAFAWNMRTGEVRILGTAIGRNYTAGGPLGLDWIVGTADLAGQRDDHLVIPDYKTGVMRQRARFSRQLSTLTVMASKVTGLRRAEVSNLYVGRRGRLFPDRAELGPADLDEQEERLRAVPARVAAAEAALADGALPELVVGEQCRYCPSVVYCPAHQEDMRGFLHPASLTRLTSRMPECTPEERKAVVVRLDLAKRHLKRLERAVKLEADHEPIALDGGMEYRRVRTEREAFTPAGEEQIDALKRRLRQQGETQMRVVWQHRVVAAPPPAPAPDPTWLGPPDLDDEDAA